MGSWLAAGVILGTWGTFATQPLMLQKVAKRKAS